jgi:hypothetical protein
MLFRCLFRGRCPETGLYATIYFLPAASNLPSCPFHSAFETNMFNAFLISPMRATSPTHLDLIDVTLSEEYRLQSSTKCTYFYPSPHCVLRQPQSSIITIQYNCTCRFKGMKFGISTCWDDAMSWDKHNRRTTDYPAIIHVLYVV